MGLQEVIKDRQNSKMGSFLPKKRRDQLITVSFWLLFLFLPLFIVPYAEPKFVDHSLGVIGLWQECNNTYTVCDYEGCYDMRDCWTNERTDGPAFLITAQICFSLALASHLLGFFSMFFLHTTEMDTWRGWAKGHAMEI